MTEGPWRVEDHADPDTLPGEALALFGQDAYSTGPWYGAVLAAGVPDGARAIFHCVTRGGQPVAVFPMLVTPAGLGSLTTPYTVCWSPMLRAGLSDVALAGIGRATGRHWRGHGSVRLDALDPDAPSLAGLLAGWRGVGLVALHFDHFGNWHIGTAGENWAGYLAGRPGELRSTIKRQTRRLVDRMGAAFTLVRDTDGLEAALDAYAHVYEASWKESEPFPDFNPVLMRRLAAAGGLRLGVLRLEGQPIAAQFWMVHASMKHGGWAGVQKLAHDEAQRHLAPGTVLTALMIRHLLDTEQVASLDFGRGDDAYKASWTGARRQRVGILLAAPWQKAGLVAVVRHGLGRLRRRLAARGAAEPMRNDA